MSIVKLSSLILRGFVMTINNKNEKKMTETSASVCLCNTSYDPDYSTHVGYCSKSKEKIAKSATYSNK